MDTYTTLQGTTVLDELRRIVELHDDMKNAYFWRPPSSASSRRSYEKNRSNALEFVLNGVEYHVDQRTTCSCKNIYYSLSVTVAGKKANVRALRKLLSI